MPQRMKMLRGGHTVKTTPAAVIAHVIQRTLARTEDLRRWPTPASDRVGGAAAIEAVDREQLPLMPPLVADRLPEDHRS